MKAVLLVVASLYALFMALASLLGQLFFAQFSASSMIIALGSAGAGVAALLSLAQRRARWPAVAFCGVGLLGIPADAAGYYGHPQLQGNYYAWFLMVPLCLAFAFIALHEVFLPGEPRGGR